MIEPEPQQQALAFGLIVVLEATARMQDDIVVEPLDVTRLKVIDRVTSSRIAVSPTRFTAACSSFERGAPALIAPASMAF